MGHYLEGLSTNTLILIGLSIILLAGFFFTRLTKKVQLPNVSGYIVAGILIGPHCLCLIPQQLADNMNFISDIALAFIAFGVGRFFKKETLRDAGLSVIVITLFESLVAGLLVTIMMLLVFHMELSMALLLGAIATATAPASTMMTINQYHARGEFVNTLLQVVALDDVVCLLVFSIVAALVTAMEYGTLSVSSIALPILYNLGFMALGALFGLLLHRLLWPHRSTDNRLIITVALLLGLSGLCTIFDVSPLLSCMVLGAVYRNKAHDKELFCQLNVFTPPIMLMFFVVSGMNLDITMLGNFGLVGLGYFLIRIAGKYLGAYLGCLTVKSSSAIRRCLGVALVPQAGVAIGLAYLAQRILPPEIGSLLMTIILASSVLYELIGPACAKAALFRSGAIRTAAQKDAAVKAPETALAKSTSL
ncbi:MAG: cation:proton antiporter [Lachnospiraceae bacterium]|nr:cation:proton antiporter [Lachnospiraceae bacterium]